MLQTMKPYTSSQEALTSLLDARDEMRRILSLGDRMLATCYSPDQAIHLAVPLWRHTKESINGMFKYYEKRIRPALTPPQLEPLEREPSRLVGCPICVNELPKIIFIPCGHTSCNFCLCFIKTNCPTCQADIDNCVKIIL